MDSKKVLIIEDDPSNQTLFKLFLKNEPYALIPAYSAEEALRFLESEQVDVILLDLNLEGDGDGATLVQKIKQLPDCSSVPVFVVSGLDEQQFAGFGIDDKVNGYFRKPVRKKTLVSALAEVT